MPKTRVAVVFGGRSGEHAISCISAASVLRALDRDRYDVIPVGILPDGRWVLADIRVPGKAPEQASTRRQGTRTAARAMPRVLTITRRACAFRDEPQASVHAAPGSLSLV